MKCQALTQKSCRGTTPNINGQVVFHRKDLMTLWQLGLNKREGSLLTQILYCLLHLTSRLIWSFVWGLIKECLLSQLLQLTSAPLALFSPLSCKLIYNPNPENCLYKLKQNNFLKTVSCIFRKSLSMVSFERASIALYGEGSLAKGL